MRLRTPSAMLGVVLLTGTAQGADTGAPLESSRQELRKLSGDQRASTGPSAAEGLRPGLPAIQTPGQESLPAPQLTDPEKLERERKRQKNERKNWLVNGVEQLERKDKGKAAGAFSSEEIESNGSDPHTPDSTDPQYLLKLYDDQKKADEVRKVETKPQRAPQSDPLAPFLQGWLGNSPVRGQFFDEFARKPAGAATGAGAAGPVPGNGNRDLGPGSLPAANPVADLPVQSNPYLTDLSRPIRSEPAVSAPVMQNALNPAAGTPSSNKPPIPLAETPAETRPPERKPFPAPLADDRKYFPQLKKF